MESFVLFFLLIPSVWGDISIEWPEHDVIEPVKGLIERELGPEYVNEFTLKKLEKENNKYDMFHITVNNGSIELAGTCATSLATALQWYLKRFALTQKDWYDHQLQVSLPLPRPPKGQKLMRKRNSPLTYYQNVCTVSYSMWHWDWNDWEKHIDWMALNGINMPLAFTGQEKVWQSLFTNHFNVSKTGLERFFAGAAFLAWGRMGNIRGGWVKGPLPDSFIQSQYELQVKILERFRQYGMIPVMPAFAGHVPEEVKTLFPQAKITRSAHWCAFPKENCCVYAVEPTDPLYQRIGQLFIEELRRIYPNASSIYQADSYNEISPRSFDAAYLKSSSRAVAQSIRAGDPKGVWLMQGWLFVSEAWTTERIKAYLSGVNNDQMIILDLYSEAKPQFRRTENYFGKSWIYCVLHNFGGNRGMRGDLPTIARDPFDALDYSKGSMLGIGLTMEGIYQNYIVYDMTLEMSWASKPIDYTAWVIQFTKQRYHSSDVNAIHAWMTLAHTAYSCTRCFGGVGKSIVVQRPGWRHRAELTYSPLTMMIVWQSFLLAAPQLGENDVYRFDLVDITRQALVDLISKTFKELKISYATPGSATMSIKMLSKRLLSLIQDVDLILGTNDHYLLGYWLEKAKFMAKTPDEVAYYEYQARNQITRWGDNNKNRLNDYASKQWAGLVGEYYHKRWEIFLTEVMRTAESRAPDWIAVESATEQFEIGWQLDRSNFSTQATNDTVSISKKLFQKYSKLE